MHPNVHCKCLSAFFFFCADERAKVKAAHPNFSIGEMGKELGARWAKIGGAAKVEYEEKAKKDKARYEAAMKAYKK